MYKGKSLIDQHPRSRDIDRDILARQLTYQSIAKKYNLGTEKSGIVLVSKRAKQLKLYMTAADSTRDDWMAMKAREQVGWIIDETKKTLEQAKVKKDYKAQSNILGNAVGAVRLLAELDGDIKRDAPPAPTGIQVAIQALIMPKAGDPLPEAPQQLQIAQKEYHMEGVNE